ncbi:MAG: protein-L-isoaspartate(D-aspartate) O-methyltransferase [Bacteroidia bacterium]|nr:protein-L-isoaspartate(D-aspartate) O-methyltransferase [Bacteroidia bacterium]MBT8268434.1 protein-L-isoaspartate(D-aspartate) O-methyltransferase [Bacteroidia bacterium]NNF82991.1 protein-L-isoaspartate(D-aspartate) O-methyltransferase [Flavobacteriaceae bacterium]NNK70059.1 protein-L-isoaspartate(D-aspartate) O-methyltransferase [Flavobacteriaceae bacterium]NNL78972.1 protein-L-isoaspartate(D-aspartate) O-methyltransferase [Flavobacteriaceae bacterium]
MRILPVLFIVLFSMNIHAQNNYELKRHQMVQEQVKNRGINHGPTLKAMKSVPRHEFVLQGLRPSAYLDTPLPIGHKQTISQPYIVAFMTSELNPKPKDRVLEIGTGSGYQAAVLAEIVDTVYTIEIVEPLGIQARNKLQKLGYDNVKVRIGDGYNGWPDAAPFDAIIVTAAVEEVPQPLIDQLAEGGRMIIPVGPHRDLRNLQLIKRRKGKLITKNRLPVRFVPFTREKDSL